MAAPGGNGFRGIVKEHIWRLITGCFNAQDAVAVERVGLAVAVQVVVGGVGAGQRPLMLIPPDVVAHDENPHRGLVQHSVVDAFQPVVEPPQVHAVHVDGHGVGGKTEVVVSRHAGAAGAVLPRANEQLLSPPRVVPVSILPHTQEVANGAAEEYVVPATDIQRGDVDLRVVVLNAQLLPVVVVFRMGQPIVEVVRQPILQVGELLKRMRAERLLHAVRRLYKPAALVGGGGISRGDVLEIRQGQLKHGPGHVEAKLESSSLVGPSFVVVGSGHVRNDGGQVRRLGQGCQPLGGAHIGGPVHPDLAR